MVMPCSCADGWSTTTIAREKHWTWRHASVADQQIIQGFQAAGGTGNPSIDKFVTEELISHSQNRFANTFFLIGADGNALGFASNSMGTVKLKDDEMMGLNMGVVPHVPVLFLHRLGVLTTHQRKGIAKLLVWRTFEALVHSCTHSAAAAIALLVEPENIAAKSLYKSLFFERVENTDRKHELHVLPYDSAVSQIP